MRTNLVQLKTDHKEDYDKLLPIFIYPTDDQAKSMKDDMDKIIDKCSVVIDRHSMEIHHHEQNKWIDQSYFLIGKANFYKHNYASAEEMFSFVAKKYKKSPRRYQAAEWLSRIYIEEKEYPKANAVLTILEDAKASDLPKGLPAEIAEVRADYFLRQEQYQQALPHLEDAIRLTKDKQLKARLTFILAQTYENLNRNDRAVVTYAQVEKLHPDYDMAFYARIRQALAYDRKLDATKIREMLNKMLKDRKYDEYQDVIYYALAQIEITDHNDQKAIELLVKSTQHGSHPKQKIKSFHALADLYFEYRKYKLAAAYYDSTASKMSKDDPDYNTIKGKADNLGELVAQLDIIDRQDSLLKLAEMDPKERQKKIMRIIADQQAAERARQQAAKENQANPASPFAGGSQPQAYNPNNQWYFYNPTTVASGKADFLKTWGQRKNEDNWRRSDKGSVETAIVNDQRNPSDSTAKVVIAGPDTTAKAFDNYLANVPLTDSSKVSALNKLITALYASVSIYKEKLHDNDNAVETFSRLVENYDTSHYAPEACYQLYRIYYDREQSGSYLGGGFKDNSDYYKNLILTKYPTSDYARIINDPDYLKQLDEKDQKDRVAYEETYTKYTRRQYSDVLTACNTVMSDQPKNAFLPKYYLLKALTIGALGNPDNYEQALRETFGKYPKTEAGDKARELLGIFKKAQKAAQDTLNANKKDLKDSLSSKTTLYTFQPGVNHFYALVIPKDMGDINKVKFGLSNFDQKYDKVPNLRITNSFLDKDHHILIVRTFKDETEAMEYFMAIKDDDNVFKDLDKSKIQSFIISVQNFTTLFRNKDVADYMKFFEKNYK